MKRHITPTRFLLSGGLRRFAVFMLLALYCFGLAAPQASALSEAQRQLMQNDVVYFDIDEQKITSCGVSALSGGSVTQLQGASPKAKIFNYLLARGLTAEQAAGLMGNMQQESGFVPDRQQGPNNPNPSNWPSGGWGLIQWTGGRRDAIVQAMNEAGIGNLYSQAYANGNTPADQFDKLLLFQLDFLWQEFQTTHKSSYEGLKSAKTVRDATDEILVRFEHPFSPSLKWEDRQGDARWQREMSVRDPNAQAIFNDKSINTGGGAAATTTASTGGKTVIAIDPGHGSTIAPYVDTVSGLKDRETNNQPEGDDVLAVSKRVKAELEQAGYEVILLRDDTNPNVNKRARVDAAVAAKASLAVSIHTAPNNLNDVWPQRVGTYREFNGKRVELTNADVAKKSQTYADAIAEARTAAEGHAISLDTDNSHQAGSFNRDDIFSPGNVSLVQLWGQDIPWVYNEIGQDDGTALSDGMKTKYADGLVAGITKAVPAANTGSSQPNCTTSGGTPSSGSLSAKTLEYAWPDFRGRGYVTPKPEWQVAYTAARAAGKYIGGVQYPGIDCGGFVTNLIIDSGFDPTYNHGGLIKNGASYTPVQYAWLQQNWTDLGPAANIDVASLRPGDVAITRNNPGHTFVYVGEIPGFGSKIASASMDDRAPMADTSQSPTSAKFEWFRKK